MSTGTKARKLKRKKSTTYLGSWNLQGKATHLADLVIMSQDMKTRKIAVCAMQETMNEYAGETRMANGDCYIFFGKQANGYRESSPYYSISCRHKTRTLLCMRIVH